MQGTWSLRPTATGSRASMLVPFYLCSPYLIIRLGSVLFVHGGLLATKVVKKRPSSREHIRPDGCGIHSSMQKDPLAGMRQAIQDCRQKSGLE